MRKITPLFISLLMAAVPALTQTQPARAQEPAWTTARVEKKMPALTNAAVLRKVRASRQKGYDRVVFEFDGNSLPDHRVEFKRPPFHLGESDQTVKVPGRAFISVMFRPAIGYNPDTGQRVVEGPEGSVRLTVLRALTSIYDYEGDVIYILGLSARKPFRAQALTDPARLVVDIKH
ncbi:MAG TPA: hypothetical protein VN256_07460 [Pyrinomonadaceae bacterium]|nr:hypothetical protein [Pyrinomonadaceae bacterium]